MKPEDFKKRMIACIILILLVSGILSIKSFWDNRKEVHYSEKLQEIMDKLDNEPVSQNPQSLYAERMKIQKKISEIYGFPKLFFFSLVLVNVVLSIWGLKTLSKFDHGTSMSRRYSLRLILALFVFSITILCFFLMEYHQVVRFGWAFMFLLLQGTLIAFVFALGVSEEVYDTIMGHKKDKDLIEGPPPPAW
ncbi:hypothetical protein JW926_03560 [Candidatus Sumerlaeota bacterium]|nr:hypothetical protein [Candidatus Sumerlaeota bacterium]